MSTNMAVLPHRLQQMIETNRDARHVCVILFNEKVLVTGISRRLGETQNHAETNALRELFEYRKRTREPLRGLTLVVVRYRNGGFRESKPCRKCCEAIKATGLFKDVCYSTSEGHIERTRASKLHSDYITTGDEFIRDVLAEEKSTFQSAIEVARSAARRPRRKVEKLQAGPPNLRCEACEPDSSCRRLIPANRNRTCIYI